MPEIRKNYAPREIALSREGWIYLGVLCFITIGSILRNVNLLILMAGMMIAPLILNWRMAIYWLRMISAKRGLPHQIHAGQTVSIQWFLFNRSKLTIWSIGVFDSLTKLAPSILNPKGLASPRNHAMPSASGSNYLWDRVRKLYFRLRYGDQNPNRVAVQFECLLMGGNQEETVSCKIFFPERGLYRFDPATLNLSFPFGLIRASQEIGEHQEMYVAPRLGHLTPAWNRRIRSIVVGSDSQSRRRGLEEDEFHALRRWQSGDGIKQIHWRTTARLGYLSVKQFEQPDNRDFAMLLDLYCPDLDESNSNADQFKSYQEKCESVLSFAATVLLQLDSVIKGRIGIAICGAETAMVHSRIHRHLVDQSMQKLAVATPCSTPELVPNLLRLSESVSATTPLFVISSRCGSSQLDFLKRAEVDEGSVLALEETPSAEEIQWQNRIRQVWPSVCWIETDSEEFKGLFSEQKEQAENLEKLADKWIHYHAGS